MPIPDIGLVETAILLLVKGAPQAPAAVTPRTFPHPQEALGGDPGDVSALAADLGVCGSLGSCGSCEILGCLGILGSCGKLNKLGFRGSRGSLGILQIFFLTCFRRARPGSRVIPELGMARAFGAGRASQG